MQLTYCSLVHCVCFRLIIRGSETDGAVLCTTNESFELKEAETSNSLLILPECSLTKEELDAVNEPSSVCRQVRFEIAFYTLPLSCKIFYSELVNTYVYQFFSGFV